MFIHALDLEQPSVLSDPDQPAEYPREEGGEQGEQGGQGRGGVT